MFPWELLVRINRNGWKRIRVSRGGYIVSHRKQCGGMLFIIKSHSFAKVSCKQERYVIYYFHNNMEVCYGCFV